MTVTYNISPLGSDKNKNILKFSNDQAPTGKRLLLVQDYYSPKDYEVKRVPSGNSYQNIETGGLPYGGFIILWKMVADLNIKELCVLPLVTWDEERQESTEARKAAYDKALSLIKDCLALNEKKGKPFDGIIFSGYMGLNGEYQNKRVDDLKFGRIFKLKKYMNLPSVFTLPITLIGKDKSDQQEDCAALIGFFYQHVKELLEGKNRYTINKEGWQGILIKDIQGFKDMMQDIISAPVTSWDTETTGLSRTQETLLTIQIAVSSKKAYVLPWQHKDSPWSAKELEYIRKTLKKYFEFGTWKYHIYQNAKFDIIQFRTHLGIRYYNGSIVDLMSCGFALDENRKFLTLAGYPKPYSLEFVAKNFGAGDIYHEGELGKEDRTTLESEKLEDIAEYGIKDVIIPYQVAAFYFKEAKLRNDKGFVKLVSKQLSDMIFDFTVMEHNGELVDKLYLLKQRDDASELAQKAKVILDKLKGMDSVQKANDILLEKKGISATAGLFGKRWLFDINKEESQQALFFTVLGIKPLKEKKNGGGALGKDFKEVYKNKYEEVKLLDDYDKIKKIKTTFIDAHFDRFSTDKDLQSDSRIRASYGFTGVVTGRASASSPNMQQMPSRGEYAKLVKRQFIANPNHLILKADYSAHEVRNWGNVARDEKVGNAFDVGKQLRKELRYYFADDLDEWDKFRQFQKDSHWVVDKDSNIKALDYDQKKALIASLEDKKLKKISQLVFDLENQGDVHKRNYEFFFGVPAYLVTKQQRQACKAVIFGVIYGKGPKTLAEDIHGTPEEAEDIMNKLFETFKRGGDWIKHCQENGKKTCEVHSPLGRIRHLWAYKHPARNVEAAMDRKGPNSCIQGFSSDIGFMAGKIMQDLCWNWFWKKDIDFQFKYMNVVHDSTETEVMVRHLPIVSYMLEHAYSTLVHRRLRDVFGFELVCGYETEQELGASMAHTETYENSCELMRLIKEGVEWGVKNIDGYYVDPKEIEIAEHNHKIIQQFRKKELKMTHGKPVDYEMLITEDNVLDIGLII